MARSRLNSIPMLALEAVCGAVMFWVMLTAPSLGSRLFAGACVLAAAYCVYDIARTGVSDE